MKWAAADFISLSFPAASPSPPTLTRHADVIATEPTSLMLWDELVLRAFFDEQPAVHLPACPNCFVVRATLVPTVFSQFACTRTAGPGRTADRDTIRQSSRDARE